ncbi:MAG: hypothetical protein MPL62_00235 [Alphaproteobacteria bacterium]|nr:hypothetical protein [Alphaproteobacteria bacterium]
MTRLWTAADMGKFLSFVSAAFGLSMAPPLALVGGVSLTVNGVGSSEPHPLSPVGAADKKNKWTDSRPTVRPFIVCPLKFNFLRAAPAGISGRRSLERPSRQAWIPRPLMPGAAPTGLGKVAP